MDCGHKTVKMKVGTDFATKLDYDVERVRLVRETIGPDAELAIDGNHSFTVREALRFADKVQKYNIAWFEEPIHGFDFRGYGELTESCPVPVAAGESVRNHYMFTPYLDAGRPPFPAGSHPPLQEYGSGCRCGIWRSAAAYVFLRGRLPLLACPLIATAGDEAMEEFLEVCNQPVLDCMEVTVQRRDGKFYLPDIPGLPFRLDMKWLKKNGYLLSYERYS